MRLSAMRFGVVRSWAGVMVLTVAQPAMASVKAEANAARERIEKVFIV
jgi:hypothetical protein